jgi:hypothetical protein
MKRALAIAAFAAAALPMVGSADHSWGDYHWARTGASFSLKVINSTTPDWDSYVAQAVNDWTVSTVLDMEEDPYGSTDSKVRRQCSAPDGMVRICNLAYGQNGWLGIAGISIDANGHIIKGYTKLNDTYFSMGYYNAPVWKQSVTCQELGHNVGLAHQDENFYNQSLYSCMDYQDPPYPNPDDHDREQLKAIYGHVDSYNSYASSGSGGGGGGCKGRACQSGQDGVDIGWGMSLGRRGAHEVFLRIDPHGIRHLTHVRWVEGHEEH